MTDLQSILDRHNIRQKDLAFITGCTTRSVYNWVQGRRELPRAASLLLQALDEGRIDARRHRPDIAEVFKLAKAQRLDHPLALGNLGVGVHISGHEAGFGELQLQRLGVGAIYGEHQRLARPRQIAPGVHDIGDQLRLVHRLG